MSALNGWHEREELAHGRVSMIERDRLIPATYHFNPTLATDGESIWMVYRRISPDEWLAGPRTLGLCRLGEDLQPEPDSNVDLSSRIVDPPERQRWHADPRLFMRGDRIWLSYHDNYRLSLTPLDPNRLPETLHPQAVELVGRNSRERERNWGFFDDGELKAVYTIPSQVILAVGENGARFEASSLYETPAALPWDHWRWGEPHGGCMPVRVGAHWCAFFQSASYDPSTDLRNYFVGFYGFEIEPPHRIAFMSAEPILDAGSFPGERSFYKDWSVVYPSGALFKDGRWLVSLGVHDRTLGLVSFEHATLLRGCVAPHS